MCSHLHSSLKSKRGILHGLYLFPNVCLHKEWFRTAEATMQMTPISLSNGCYFLWISGTLSYRLDFHSCLAFMLNRTWRPWAKWGPASVAYKGWGKLVRVFFSSMCHTASNFSPAQVFPCKVSWCLWRGFVEHPSCKFICTGPLITAIGLKHLSCFSWVADPTSRAEINMVLKLFVIQ